MEMLGDVTVNNLEQLKKLNAVVFPVSYSDKFYQDVLASGEMAKLGTLILIDLKYLSANMECIISLL